MSYPPLSIIIPVYNSGDSVLRVVEEVETELLERVESLEFILVNDGSTDTSPQVIRELAQRNPRVTSILLTRNFGQHNALLCGLREARASILITMDDDGQHPASEIPKLLDCLLDGGKDVVYGMPEQDEHNLWRNLSSWVTKLSLGTVMGKGGAFDTSAFRVFRRELVDVFRDFNSPNIVIDVLLAWSSSQYAAVNVEHRPRRQGESTYTFRKLLGHAANMLTGFTALPLRFASLVGLAAGFIGICLLIFVVLRALLSGTSVPGFAFTATIITFFAGVQLFCLGIMGEYLARMHFRSMNRPPYAVREQIGAKKDSE